MKPTCRVWGAVMTEDGPVAEVRDLPGGLTIGEIEDMDPAWRVWRIDVLPAGREGHSRGPACIPGRPCARCHKAAQSWWGEHARRTEERRYHAIRRKPDPMEYHRADWGEQRSTCAEAEADARAARWPWVLVSNGHGRPLEWIQVSEVPR